MRKSVASIVLKVMMVWLLIMYGLLLFRHTLLKPVVDALRLDSKFFVGALLAGSVFALLAIIANALQKKDPLETATAKKNYTAVGVMLSVFGIFMTALGTCYDPIMELFFGEGIRNEEWYTWVGNIAVTDVICLAAVMMVACKIEKTPVEKHKMTFGEFITCIFMNSGVIGAGLILGFLMESLMMRLCGTMGGQAISDMMIGSDDFWRILTVGIGAPIVEELIFRKFLIDRVHKYGEGIAILISGMLFGLFHGNFAQFFHTTGLGLFLAFIYVRTGKVWYTILFHMVVNMSTSVISMKLVNNLDYKKLYQLLEMDWESPEAMELMMEMFPAALALTGWVLFLIVSVIVGWVLWIRYRKKLFLKKAPEHVEKKKLRTAFLNFGMLYFLIMGIIRFVSFYL